MNRLIGKGASPGFAVGRILLLSPRSLEAERKSIDAPERELQRFGAVIEEAKAELTHIHQNALKTLEKDQASVFEAHLMMLEDPEILSQVTEKIRTERVNAEFAYQEVVHAFLGMFQEMENEYLRERALDLKDVSSRVLRHLLGIPSADLSALTEDVIIVTHELTPSEAITMDASKILGILTEVGGTTSHTVILARTLEIPCIVGLSNITQQLQSGTWAGIDGKKGEVFIDPDDQTKVAISAQRARLEKEKKELLCWVGKATQTKDGRSARLFANIGSPNDIPLLQRYDAEGVGLFRTEFLFMDRDHAPTEEEQFQAYRAVLEAMSPREVLIRTLDAGGDKRIPYLNIPEEPNPFLGNRAIRYCLKRSDLFKVQLRALLRASAYGSLGIMFPMITTVEELLQAKSLLEVTRQALLHEGVSVADRIQVGIMIEVPAAALASDVLAEHVDFFSIGTNDLIQYTCAVDRMNEEIHDLYDPFHPAVLRLIQMVIQNGHHKGIHVGMCGEMAGTPELTELLLGMGLKEFSMPPSSILRIRKLVHAVDSSRAVELSKEILGMRSAAEIRKRLRVN